jgi:hypothetical protein
MVVKIRRLDDIWRLSSIVYGAAVNDVVELERRAEDGCESIHNMPGVFESSRQSLMRRAARGVELQGQQVQNLWLFIVVKTIICNVRISN